MINTIKISVLQAMPSARSNCPLDLRAILQNHLYPVPLWIPELKPGDITVIYVHEYGHRLARKTSDSFEVIDCPDEYMEIHVVRLDIAVTRGWVRITAPPPIEPRSLFYGGDVNFEEIYNG